MKNVNKMYLFLVLSLFAINFNASNIVNFLKDNKISKFFFENGKKLISYDFRNNKVKAGLYLFGSIVASLEANALFSNINNTTIGKMKYCPNSFKKFGFRKATSYFVKFNNAFGRFFRDGLKSAFNKLEVEQNKKQQQQKQEFFIELIKNPKYIIIFNEEGNNKGKVITSKDGKTIEYEENKIIK